MHGGLSLRECERRRALVAQQSVEQIAMERDAASANAEYGASDAISKASSISKLCALASAPASTSAPQHGIAYSGFVDPSGGSIDSMSLAIGHVDYGKQTVIIDCIRETVPPFSPEAVCEDFSRVDGLRCAIHLSSHKRLP